MTNNLQFKQYIDKILNSRELESCKTEKKLLVYLFENTFKEEPLNEITIAIDVFSKNSLFNPSDDSIVRVHTHNLRKKLYTYYLSEGKDDKIQIEIPKGGYELKFIDTHNETKKISRFFKANVTLYSIIALLIIIIISQWYLNNKAKRGSFTDISHINQSPIWKSNIGNEKPVIFVIGNQFFFTEYNKKITDYFALGGLKIVRVSNINSMEDLNNYSSIIGDTSTIFFEPYKPALIEKEMLWSFRYLYPILDNYQSNFDMKLSSELTFSDLQNYNVIFIGITKTLGILNSLLAELRIQYALFPHRLIVNYAPDSIATFRPKGASADGPRKDYVLINKVPGPKKQNYIMMITCTDLAGVYEAVKAITEKESLHNLETQLVEKHGSVPPFYELLLEVNSISRIGFSNKLIASFPISPDIDLVKLPEE